MLPDAGWWSRLETVFQDALRLPVDQRAPYLDRVCGADADQRAEIDAMLAAEAPHCALRIERLVRDDPHL